MISTYRLQFRGGVDFARAAALVPYLKRLGVSHLYASPIFEAAEGSTHGYDVVNPNVLDPVLGGEAGFAELHDALKQHGLGLVIDIVPNHMAVGESNPWWWDALARGADSPYAGHFDIDWEAEEGRGRIALPMLGAPYAEELQGGNLKLYAENGRFRLGYFDRFFPLSAETREALKGEDLDRINGDADRLHEILEQQNYRLVHWRAAPDSRNWRRFFDIDNLIGVRVDDPAVFAATHELTLDLVRSGRIDGLRIDHVDGLAAPTTYLKRLREAVNEAGAGKDFPIYVEKILGPDEELPETWPVDGTTGYEALNEITGLLLPAGAPEALIEVARELTGQETPFEEELKAAKAEVIDTLFAGELEGLTSALASLAQREIATAEIGAVRGRRAINQLLIALPVYRVYPGRDGITAPEEETLRSAAETARAQLDEGDHPALDLLVRLVSAPQDDEELDFARRLQQLSGPVMAKSLEDTACYRNVSVLVGNEVGGHPPHVALSPERFLERARRRQETFPRNLVPTATHDTKRGADTRARLVAIAGLHEEWRAAVDAWFGMNAGIRGEIDGSPAPDPVTEYLFYQSAAAAWPPLLEADDEAGARDYAARLQDYMIKAAREAKLKTKWTAPNEAFESTVRDFVNEALKPGPDNLFLPSLHRFVRRADPATLWTSLSQLLVQTIAPGVPDIYQGSEAFDFSLVDPDNRRIPDFDGLAEGLPASAAGLLGQWRDGRLKQFVTARALALRGRHRELFLHGEVSFLPVSGAAAGHLLALCRRHGDISVVALLPREPGRLSGDEGLCLPAEIIADTTVELPGDPPAVGDVLCDRTLETSGGRLPVAACLDQLPVALIEIPGG
ncbi:malto-oligosyltrehalose synthase [Lutibaculum baratangense]|uniref:Malto-oligosyltrehalose synthase n=1 Tax=Lutibaculum baratangense AMV1 TaxID=631454 RepID=V4T7J6_9HYPH|nr:malto-oligosyltrehalose synthase [Lutibaculum baratangense]ESR22593.1 Malto-oligosyltrehalose synthase [Lutibaculum baratangense AMV1]